MCGAVVLVLTAFQEGMTPEFLLDLQLRAPHISTGPGQDQSLWDVFCYLVLKLPSKGAALGCSCRSSPCCRVFSGVCSVVAVSSLPLSSKVKELLPQIPGLVSDTQFPKLRFWGLVHLREQGGSQGGVAQTQVQGWW